MLVATLLFDDDRYLDRKSTLRKIMSSRRHDLTSCRACPSSRFQMCPLTSCGCSAIIVLMCDFDGEYKGGYLFGVRSERVEAVNDQDIGLYMVEDTS
ncbi:hypothetical protein Y032_0004g1840 [Ancylostoma ceylanicum]|uniref:Uncharacterized protein n=1 Tax=Ancylostoma ceylanicum TaxID=53326 RepID=A0A016VTH7_9BILA|nr:hypothetical protein Y032_0004g1840 [Ancylostoma ceylanicum]